MPQVKTSCACESDLFWVGRAWPQGSGSLREFQSTTVGVLIVFTVMLLIYPVLPDAILPWSRPFRVRHKHKLTLGSGKKITILVFEFFTFHLV